jgi:hypothetical protein
VLSILSESDSIRLAGLVVIGLEVFVSAPQFYVLIVIEDPMQLCSSALACAATEAVGAILNTRTVRINVIEELSKRISPATSYRSHKVHSSQASSVASRVASGVLDAAERESGPFEAGPTKLGAQPAAAAAAATTTTTTTLARTIATHGVVGRNQARAR